MSNQRSNVQQLFLNVKVLEKISYAKIVPLLKTNQKNNDFARINYI